MKTPQFAVIVLVAIAAIPAAGQPALAAQGPGTVRNRGIPSDFAADAACVGIVAPAGPLESGYTVTPVAVVKNLGTEPASFWTRMTVGTVYMDSTFVSDLAAQDSATIPFPEWVPGSRGSLTVRCSTMLGGDENPLNDAFDTSAVVQVSDVAPSMILSPPDTVDSGLVLQPWSKVRNLGTVPATFYTYMLIADWRDSTEVQNLQVGEERDLVFGNWPAIQVGRAVARCSTAWILDRYPSNDTLSRRFVVRGTGGHLDVGVSQLIQPAAVVLDSSYVIPSGTVINNSPQATEVIAGIRFQLASVQVYADSQTFTLGGGQLDTLSLSPWLAAPIGDFTAEFWISALGDTDPSNDVMIVPFSVADEVRDVGVLSITAPVGRIIRGPVAPKAQVRNLGTTVESFSSRFTVLLGGNAIYSDTVLTTALPAGGSAALNFRAWNADTGRYVVCCSTMLTDDNVPANDFQRANLSVETIPMAIGWREMRPIPVGAKEVKGGGSLTFVESNRLIYALKGYKTQEFYGYEMTKDSWRALAPIPLGTEAKPVDKGGSLCNDGNRYLYATKGNNTDGFYRYDVALDSWRQLPAVPMGPSNKRVKGGTKMAYASTGDSGYCYLLKGYKSEFYRFDVRNERWESLPPAPLGISGKANYKEGSFVVYDGLYSIFAVKAGYNEVFCFDLGTNAWLTRRFKDFPLYGRANQKKKVKDGAGGAWFGSSMVCLKGGNTQETWRFFPTRDSWFELDTIPQVGSTNKKKKVKTGGGIVHVGEATFFVLKGNKTYEFWRYRMPGGVGVEEEELPTVLTSTPGHVSVYPNPTRGLAFVNLARGSGPSLLRLYSVQGSLALEQPVHQGVNLLDCRGVGAGTYFIRLSGTGPFRSTRLVVEH